MNIGWIVIIIALYDLIGVLIWSGNYPYLIAGYITTPKEKRNEYDWIAIGKAVAIIIWISSVGLGIMLSQESNASSPLFYLGLITFLGTVFLGVIYINVSKRFKK